MPGRFVVFHAAVVLVCGAFLSGCSQAPQQPAPVFMLPASKVVGGPAIEGQAWAPPVGQMPARQLRYVAVPPEHKVEGMTKARVVLKQAKLAPHHSRHAHRLKAAAQRSHPTAAAKRPVGDMPAATIPLDEPARDAGATPAAKP
jgi:hypothetical protein